MTIVTECSVCTDELTNECAISVCPCGHIFHQACLDQWFKQCRNQPVCPTCRSKASRSQVIKQLYFAIPNNTTLSESPSKDSSRLRNRISTLEAQVIEEQTARRNNENKADALKEEVNKLKKSRDKLKNKEKADSTRHSALKMKCDHVIAESNELRRELDGVRKKYDKVKELESDIRIVDRVRALRQCTTEDSNWIQGLQSRADFIETFKYATMIQKEYTRLLSEHDRRNNRIIQLEKELRREKIRTENLKEDNKHLIQEKDSAKEEIAAIRLKFDLAKRVNPESETFVRICTESPLSDDLLAKLKKRKSDGASESIDLTTPPLKKLKTTPSSSTFGDSSLFNDALSLADRTPLVPGKETQKTDLKNRMERLEAIHIADESDEDMEDDLDESIVSPIIHRSSHKTEHKKSPLPRLRSPSPPTVFARVKVKTVPQRSPRKKVKSEESSTLDVSKLVAQSNLFKKERTNRGKNLPNRLGGSSRANPIKIKSTTRKPNIRDFFANTKMT